MDLSGWFQLALFVGLLFAVTKPLGLYLVRVLEPEGKTWLDRPVKPVERLIYRILGIDPKAEQDWRRYTLSLIVFSLAGMLLTYAVLRLQHLLPLNPQKFGPVAARPSLQYGGELHHQHELAELCRGIHPVLFFTDGRPRLP